MYDKTSREIYTPSEKFLTLKMLFSCWLQHLSPSEFILVHFIWARTIFWGKKSEFIMHKHFLNGIDGVISPLPFKERQLQNLLKSLVKKGAVRREHRVLGSYYELNLDWDMGIAFMEREDRALNKR